MEPCKWNFVELNALKKNFANQKQINFFKMKNFHHCFLAICYSQFHESLCQNQSQDNYLQRCKK